MMGASGPPLGVSDWWRLVVVGKMPAMTSSPARVAIFSPQEVVVAGLESMLGRHPDRVVVVHPPLELGEDDPDVVLYDALLLAEGESGAEGAEFARVVHQTTSVVLVIARTLRPDLASRAMALGADGYFSLGVDDAELLAAVESANTGWEEGDTGANPTVGSGGAAAGSLKLGHEVGLTDREVDVLTMITQGFSNQEIAEKFYLSINSVKTYIRGAYRRIGVTTRSQAVVWCLQHGFGSESDRAQIVATDPESTR